MLINNRFLVYEQLQITGIETKDLALSTVKKYDHSTLEKRPHR